MQIKRSGIACFMLVLSLTVLNSCSAKQDTYTIKEAGITVDGDISDWKDIEGVEVGDTSKLWIGQGMTKENWKGKKDLSFNWKAAYSSDKIYFLFEVIDDIFVDPAQQPLSYLNDVVEIMIDPKNRKGNRFTLTDGKKRLYGYEMHFLPSQGNEVFIDDSLIPEYALNLSQNSLFRSKWRGEIVSSKTKNGYILEFGFEIPDLEIEPGVEIGLDVDVCDDDGNGRKSLLIWSGENNEFWISMEKYPTVKFK
jgi:hypothetical protein